MIPMTVILLLSISTTNGAIDTTKIGIKKGDVFNYKLVAFQNDFEKTSKICIVCSDSGPEVLVSEGDEYSVEIIGVVGNSYRSSYKSGEQEVEDVFDLDDRQHSNFINPDWDYWPDSIAEDWAWVIEAEADPKGYWPEYNIEDFEANTTHQVENDVFNTLFEMIWTFNSSDEAKSIEKTQHIDYGLTTGAISYLNITETQINWDGSIIEYGDERELLSITTTTHLPTSSDLTTETPFNLNLFLIGLAVLVFPKRIHGNRE